MLLRPVQLDISIFPPELHDYISGAELFDSSCSREANVFFIDKDGGLYLKTAPKGTLAREADMLRFFHLKRMSAAVLAYISDERDWLLTNKLPGCDGISECYLEQPERLCDVYAAQLNILHNTNYAGCPVPNHTERYIAAALTNHRTGNYDGSLFPDSWGYTSAEESLGVIERSGHLLQTDCLLHGDYCLPNIILDDWAFSGFVDVGGGGVGDRHVDLFWAQWTLTWNLKTDKYNSRFIDAYGRGLVDDERLRVVAAIEVFQSPN